MKSARCFLLASFLLPLLTAGRANAQATASGGSLGVSGTASPGGVRAEGEGAGVASSPSDGKAEDAWSERDRKLDEAATLTGGVGLLHTQHAQGGAPGQFRIGFTTEYMSAGFLCSAEFPCQDPLGGTRQRTTDSTDYIGGRLTLSMQLLKFLDAYVATSANATSNENNRPRLLQVLGDSIIGAKAHGQLSRVFHVGGAFELGLVNGTGAVGLDGGGTTLKFRGLGTADLRGMEKPLPLRFSLNATYVLDNTGEVVRDVERARGTSISRIERFGLGLNRVDHLDFHLGGEVFLAQDRVRPFVEYSIAVPINRQGYQCRADNVSNDKCMLNEPLAPSSLTFGGRFFPWKRGFNLLAALDVGLTGVGTFVEEVRPTPPWMLYLGAGWAFDTVDRPSRVVDRVVEKAEAPTGRKIRGFVHEIGQTAGIPSAIVSWDNHPELTSLATGSDGRFTTHPLDEGQYMFGVRAEGYKPAQCTAAVVRPSARPAGAVVGAEPAPTGTDAGGDVTVDCALEALAKVGSLVGKVKDQETGAAVAATVKVSDSAKKELSGTADASSGAFRFELVTPGEAQVVADAEGYLAASVKIDVAVRKETPIEISLTKKPKNSLVSVSAKEIVIKQQIQFAVDSAVILPASDGLLTEIADVLIKNPRIRRVEVQGHTDNTGTAERNMRLSDERASSVVAWLTSHGVSADRLVAKGYGQTKPIAPNVTTANKAKNRRVQFVITDQDAAPAVAPGGAKGGPKPAAKPGDIKFPL